MISYLFYFLLTVGLSILLTAAFRRIRGDEKQAPTAEEDIAFERRMEAIEQRFGRYPDGRDHRRQAGDAAAEEDEEKVPPEANGAARDL